MFSTPMMRGRDRSSGLPPQSSSKSVIQGWCLQARLVAAMISLRSLDQCCPAGPPILDPDLSSVLAGSAASPEVAVGSDSSQSRGGRGGLPDMMSSICSLLMVSYLINAPAIICSLSILSLRISSARA